MALTSSLTVAGCLGFLPGPVADPDPYAPFPSPSVRATYESGTATIVVTGAGAAETVTFDRVAPGAQLVSQFGAGVTWRSATGWGLTLTAYDGGMALAVPAIADLTMARVNELDVWTTANFATGNRCIVDIEVLSEESISGRATCLGLRWIDGLSSPQSFAGPPPYIEGQAEFDAEVTFEAH